MPYPSIVDRFPTETSDQAQTLDLFEEKVAESGVPRGVHRKAQLIQFSEIVAEKLVIDGRLPSPLLERYRQLAASLHHAQAERGIRVLLIASAVAGEGKTLTSVNLALTLSESYCRQRAPD